MARGDMFGAPALSAGLTRASVTVLSDTQQPQEADPSVLHVIIQQPASEVSGLTQLRVCQYY